VPTPGQEPTYEFDNYRQGMTACYSAPAADHIKVVDLAFASQIPPSPDQAQSFAQGIQELQSQNVAMVAAAGNSPGAVEEPGAEPGVFSVGATSPRR